MKTGTTCAPDINAPAEKLYAFWKYDCFPYLLAGEVQEVLPGGIVIPTSYGGRRFYYTAILPGETGRKLEEDLRQLTEAHRQAHAELDASFSATRQKLLALAGLGVDGKPTGTCAVVLGDCDA